MGMFDTVVIEGLKLKAPKELLSFLKANNAELPNDFQTKDLNNGLLIFSINQTGQVYETIHKPTGKKKVYECPLQWRDNRAFLEKLYWNLKYKPSSKKSERLVDETKPVKQKVKFTNTFNMYTYEQIGGRYVDLSYNVAVVDGKVKSIKLHKWGIESEVAANKRHKEDALFKQKMEASFMVRRDFQSKWYYPLLKETINPAVFFSRMLVQKLCSKIVTWSYRWHGV